MPPVDGLSRQISWVLRYDPVQFARELLDFHPDQHQAGVLQLDARRGILACHRQWGKSTTAAAKAIHHAAFHPD